MSSFEETNRELRRKGKREITPSEYRRLSEMNRDNVDSCSLIAAALLMSDPAPSYSDPSPSFSSDSFSSGGGDFGGGGGGGDW